MLPNGTEISQDYYPVLDVATRSTTVICIHNGLRDSSVSAWGPQRQLSPTGNVSISLGNLTTAEVKYTLSTGPNSTGFYGLHFEGFCNWVPVAVGYEPSQVNFSDFPGLFASRSCCSNCGIGQIAGYTNARIAYVTSVSTFTPTINITQLSVSSAPTANGAENITFTMNLRSFSQPFTAGLSLNKSNVMEFAGNPRLVVRYPDVSDDCLWSPTGPRPNMNATTFQNLPAGYLQVDAPAVRLGTFSNITYRISLLITGPIGSYTAITSILYVNLAGSTQGLYVVARYFPVSISGQLQTISGKCGISPGSG
jgi:hypothetical protein